MKLLRVLLLLSASLLLVAAVSACGDDDDDDEDNGDGAAVTTAPADDGDDGDDAPATTAAADDGGGEGAVEVEAQDFAFVPASFAVTADEEVTVTVNNSGSAPHTLTVYTDEEYTDAVADADTGTLNGGETGEFTATFSVGEYYFRCEVHPGQMTGQLEAE
jgi:plastocyanin